jgi:hypothetical protein
VIFGRHAADKARRCADILLGRLAADGLAPERFVIECLGAGNVVNVVPPADPIEVVLRIAVADRRRAVVERFARELTPLITAGPQGLTGYGEGRPTVREQFGYWPTLIDRAAVSPRVEYLDV